MNNLEDIVQIALRAFDKTSIDTNDRNYFELQFRRLLMQMECRKETTKTETYTTANGLKISKKLLHG